jgi:crossover junction endodeoxyribonuclease RuvC
MLVLGIDPGIAITGYGLVSVDQAGNPKLVAYGVIDSTAVRTTSSRLSYLYDELREILAKYQPTHAAVEKIFFQKNLKTVSAVMKARCNFLVLAQAQLELSEYTPK